MRNNNTYNFGEYIGDTLFYAVIGFIWYKNILLHCIDGMSYVRSRTVLIIMIVAFALIGILINLRKNRTE